MNSKLKTLILSIGVPLAGGMLIGYLTSRSGTYEAINKPPLSPPPVVFPIVWAILYILMGLALYLVLTANISPERKRKALTVFAWQLALNFLWPVIFFTFRTFWAAAVCLVFLIVFIILTYLEFRKTDIRASRLLIPYLLWCVFALYLNIGVAILN